MVRCHNHVLQHARGGDPNQHRCELAILQPFWPTCTLDQGKEEQCVVVDRIGIHKCAPQPLFDLCVILFLDDSCPDG
jgi:hypothetical protein